MSLGTALVQPEAARPEMTPAGRSRPRGPRGLRAALLDAAVVVGLTSGLLVLVLRLWEAVPKVPFGYAGPFSREFFAGDATGPLLLARSMEQGQWWWRPNLNLGAPFGQDLRDFPAGPDHLHLIILKALIGLLGDPFAAANAYYLLGYVLVALSAWGVLRLMGISRPVAVVVGVLFTFLPYHGGRGPEHLFLAAYFAVPLGALLLYWQLTGRAAWGPARRAGDPGLTRGRLGGLLVIALVLGSASAYYALHFLVLLAVVGLLQMLLRRDWRPLLSAALLGLPVLATLLLNSAPAILYAARNGPNSGLARTAEQSWFFGMNLTQLIMPVEDHRLGVFAAVERAYRLASGFYEPGHTLGLIGSVTLLALAVVLVRQLRLGRSTDSPRARLREQQAALALLAGLVATAGGGSLVIALLGFGEARVWARMSIYIAFFVLVALASWLDDALDWWRRRGSWTWAAWPALAGLLLFGVWDQTSAKDVPPYQAAQAAFDSDYAFMRQAYATYGDGAMIWQLPYVNFPEGNIRSGEMFDYDLFKGYLHAPELRWSYGAMKSRPAANWQAQASRRTMAEQLPMLAAAGFAAVYVDTFGLPDQGVPLPQQIRDLLGQDATVSDDGRLALFDLRPLAKRIRSDVGADVVRGAAADVLQQSFGRTFGNSFATADFAGRWAAGPSAELTLVNPGTQPVRVDLGMLVGSRVEGTYSLRLTGGQIDETVEISKPLRDVRTSLVLSPGVTVLRLTSDAPLEPARLRTRDRTFFVGDPTVQGADLRRLLEQCVGTADVPRLLC